MIADTNDDQEAKMSIQCTQGVAKKSTQAEVPSAPVMTYSHSSNSIIAINTNAVQTTTATTTPDLSKTIAYITPMII